MEVNEAKAHRNMDDQGSKNDGYLFSLDAMWRAAGSPPGQSPAEWLELAVKLVEGIADYRAGVSAVYPHSDEWAFANDPEVTFEVTLESLEREAERFRARGLKWEYDPFCRDGDRLAIPEIARFYARHLDAGDLERFQDVDD